MNLKTDFRGYAKNMGYEKNGFAYLVDLSQHALTYAFL
jgi:hypothetical protein